MIHQNSASEATRTTTTGTTMAGTRVSTLPDDEDLAAAEEVVLALEEVAVAVLVARVLSAVSDARKEEYCAESVTATPDV